MSNKIFILKLKYDLCNSNIINGLESLMVNVNWPRAGSIPVDV